MNRRRIALGALLLLPSCEAAAPEPEDESFDSDPIVPAVERRYEIPLPEVWTAVEEAVAEEDVVIERRRRNERRGILAGRCHDGHRMKVSVRAHPGDGSQVAVTVDPPNRELAGMVQDRIGNKLSLRKARSDLFGERSDVRVLNADLRRGMEAAERTCRALGLEVVHKQLRESEGRLVARDGDGRAVRFTLQSADDPLLGTGSVLSTVAPAELLRRVSREFERQLFPATE